MSVAFAPEMALIADAVMQVGYQPGDPGDVINALTDPGVVFGALAGGAFGAALGAPSWA